MDHYKWDLKEPLPDWKIEDLYDVRLYGLEVSLPCAKIIAILHHHKIPFELIEGPKEGHKLVPVLMINGR